VADFRKSGKMKCLRQSEGRTFKSIKTEKKAGLICQIYILLFFQEAHYLILFLATLNEFVNVKHYFA